MIKYYLSLFIIFFSNFCFSMELIINAPFGSEKKLIYITGDFCQWKPDCFPVANLGNASLKFEVPSQILNSRIKFTQGSWESEACGQDGVPLRNLKLNPKKNLQIINIPSWCDSKKANGKRYHFSYFFKSLKKYRRVDVYIPTSFNEEMSDAHFILFLDGQNIFDASRSAFGVEWKADETAEVLKLNNSILVSIDNGGADRTDEYHYFKKGKEFSKEIAQSFIKDLCDEFLPGSNCENHKIVGSSLGAIFGFTTAYEYSSVFSRSVSLSFPAFAYDDYVFSFLKKIKYEGSNQNKFYFDYGGLGQDSDYGPHFKRFLMESSVQSLNLEWKEFPFHGHNEMNWSHRLFKILKEI